MTDADTRRQTHATAIEGVAMTTIERQVPADEAPPLAPNSSLAVIGQSRRESSGIRR
jgi:hypothetical protein